MTKVLFFFDTEDYVNPHAADGVLRAAKLLEAHGIRGCFNVVGWFADALLEWGRKDVAECLKNHDVGFHSHRHSHHPTINEYTDLEDYEEAKRLFLEDEKKSIEKISRVFGKTSFPAACPPGESSSYVAYYGYSELGCKIYNVGAHFDVMNNRPLYASNICCINYNRTLENFLHNASKEDVRKVVDDIPETQEVLIFCHHPHKAYVTEHPDVLNYHQKNTPREEWVLSDRRSDEEIELFYDNYEYLVNYLEENPRFEIVTTDDIIKEYCDTTRVIKREYIDDIFVQLYRKFFPLTTPDSFCLADIALACRDFLQGKDEHICGKVYGFMEEPFCADTYVTLTKDEVIKGAEYFKDGEFLPSKIVVGEKTFGPADWLRAAIDVLRGKESVKIVSKTWQIDLDEFPRLRDLEYRNWVHVPEFKDNYLSKRARLQTWTLRLPKNTKRTIY